MRRFGMMALVLAAGFSGFAGESHAGLLPVNATTTPDGGNYRYSYNVVLTSDSTIRTGDYFTIYDFQGLVANSNVQPANFAYSSATVGPTPSGTSPTDSPTVSNVTWTYTGPDTVVGQTSLGNFMVQSAYNTTTDGVFTSTTHREVDGKTDSNITETEVPVPTAVVVSGVPEPTSLALLGIGLPLAFLLGFHRRRLA